MSSSGASHQLAWRVKDARNNKRSLRGFLSRTVLSCGHIFLHIRELFGCLFMIIGGSNPKIDRRINVPKLYPRSSSLNSPRHTLHS